MASKHLGEAHIRVHANLERFHSDVNDALRKRKNQQLEIDVVASQKSLQKFKDDLQDLRNQDPINIPVSIRFNDKEVKQRYGNLKQSIERNPIEGKVNVEETITRKLKMDYREADEEMQNFQENWKDMHTTLHVHVDEEGMKNRLKDVLDEQEKRGIRIPVTYQVVARPTLPKMGGGGGGGMGPDGARRIQEEWNVVNMWGKMWEGAHGQIEQGMIDLYDGYRKSAVNAARWTMQPFTKFRTALTEANTFKEFFKQYDKGDKGIWAKTKKLFGGIVRVSKKAFSGMKRGFTAIFSGLKNDEKKLRGFFTRVAQMGMNSFRGMGRGISALFGTLTNSNLGKSIGSGLGSIMDGFKGMKAPPVIAEMSRGIKNMFSSFRLLSGKGFVDTIKGMPRDFYRHAIKPMAGYVGGFVKSTATALGSRLAGATKKAGGAIASGIGRAFVNVRASVNLFASDVLKFLGPRVLGVMSEIGGGIKATFSAWGRAVSDTVGQAAGSVKRMFTSFRLLSGDALGGMAAKAKSAFSAVSGFAKRTFANFGHNFKIMSKGTINAFRVMGKGLLGVAGRLGKNVAGRIVNSKLLYSAFAGPMKLAGKYSMAFARIGVGAFAKVTSAIMGTLMPAIMAVGAGILALGGQAIIGAVMALAGAIMSVVQGVLLMAPALVAAAGVSFAALKIGLEGVGDAVGSAFSAETVEDFEKAMEGLPDSVQQVARAFRGFKPAMDEMKTATQDNLLAGLRPGIESAMSNLFPQISRGIQETAKSWNGAFKGLLGELSSDRAGAGIKDIMDGSIRMAQQMEPVLGNLAAAFGSLAQQGAKWLEPLGAHFTKWSESFMNWSEGLKEIIPGEEMSKFDRAITNASVAAGHLGQIFGGVFKTLGNVLSASFTGGSEMLTMMGKGAQRMADATAKGSEGYKNIQGFMDNAVIAMRGIIDLMGPVFSSIGKIVSGLMEMASIALPGLTTFVEGISTALDPILNIADMLGQSMNLMFASLAPIIAGLGAVLAPILAGLFVGLADIADGLGKTLTPLMGPLATLGQALLPVILTVGEKISGIIESLSPYLNSTIVLLTALMGPLNAIISLIGDAIKKLLDVMSPMFTEHDAALQKLLEALTPVIEVIKGGLMTALESLRPLFAMLGEAMGKIAEMLVPLLPLIGDLIAKGFNMLGEAITILMPVFQVIINIIIDLVEIAIKVLIKVIGWLLETWEKVWPSISNLLKSIVDNVLVPVLATAREAIQWLGEKMRDIWNNWIKPALDDLGTVAEKVFDWLAWAVENIVAPALESMKTGFKNTVDAIKTVWETLKKVFATPISFFIETVLNDGIRPAWNSVMDFLKIEDKNMAVVANPMKAHAFASGGVLPGYTPGVDVHKFYSPTAGGLHLSGGEAIMRPEWTRAVGGPAAVERMNAQAKRGQLSPKKKRQDEIMSRIKHEHAMADGGVLKMNTGGVLVTTAVQQAMIDIVRQKYPNIHLTSATRPGHSGYHGSGQATDWATPGAFGNSNEQLSLARDIAATYPGSAQLIYDSPGWSSNIWEGQPAGAMDAGTYNTAQAGPHHNHVHWAMTKNATMPFGGGVFEGGAGGGGFFGKIIDVAKMAADWMSDKIIKPILDPITGLFDGKLAEWGNYGNMAIGAGKQAVSSTIDTAIDWIKDKNPFGGGSTGTDIDISGVAGTNLEIGKQLAEKVGWVGSEWESLKTLWHNESGWDNNAQNPTSTAYGIPQFLDQTWSTVGYSKTSDPATQIAAGIKYIQQRGDYNGSPTRALQLWNSRSPHWYDEGGIATGTGVMQKNVLEPERVLSPRQTKAFGDFVYGFMPQLINDFRKRPFTIQEGVDRMLRGWKNIQKESAISRETAIVGMTDDLTKTLSRRSKGEFKYDRPVDFVMDKGWVGRNEDNLKINLNKAVAGASFVLEDPFAYLEAEQRARERIDAEEDKAREEAKTAQDEKARAESDADREEIRKERAEAEKDMTEEQKEAAKEEWDRIDKEKEDAIKERDAAKSERDQAESDRIAEAKATGEYYYGYKTLGADGSNPNEYEQSEQESEFRRYMSGAAEFTGLDGAYSGIMARVDVLQSLGSAVETAIPAWVAAANGDPSGLQYNIAAASAANITNTRAEAQALGPSALFGAIEMLASASTGNQAPFVGTINTGMTGAELTNNLSHYENRRARQGGGTPRMR